MAKKLYNTDMDVSTKLRNRNSEESLRGSLKSVIHTRYVETPKQAVELLLWKRRSSVDPNKIPVDVMVRLLEVADAAIKRKKKRGLQI